ncbi:MAG TPA: FliM/FliN family flagellar motor switch protein [Bryobacteraceae bacterium]|jgi:flagellar motor switch protein FliN/FliY
MMAHESDDDRAPMDQVGHLGDVAIEVEVELDRKPLTVRELLELEAGSVLKMTRSAGENIDVLIGGSLVGFGEIVLVEDTIAVRITDFNIEEE